MKRIEIEHRALITKQKHDDLKVFLGINGEDLGEDDKDVFFFLVPNKICKVVNNISKKTAKIVLKMNDIGSGSDYEEIEVSIAQTDVKKSVELFEKLEVGEMMRSFQKRHNYMYKGVEVAVKFSEHWQYHVELEILIDEIGKKLDAEKQIKKVADLLGFSLMSDKEQYKYVLKLENEYREVHYR